MGKNASRSAEYFFTGKYDGTEGNDDIDAIGLGGKIYARGGDDDINVGSIAAIVYAGSGNDKVKAGAAYLEVQDTSGDLSVSGAAGAFNIRKQDGGDLKYRGGAIANILEHSGNDGSIDFVGVGGYNQITRRATGSSNIRKLKLDDITLKGIRVKNNNSGEILIVKQFKQQDGTYKYRGVYNDEGGRGLIITLDVSLVADEETGDIKLGLIESKAYMRRQTGERRKRASNGNYSIESIEYSVNEMHRESMYSQIIRVKTGDVVNFEDDDGGIVTFNDNDNIKLMSLKFTDSGLIEKLYYSESQPDIYYYQFTNRDNVNVLGRVKLSTVGTGELSEGKKYYTYEMDMFAASEVYLPLEEKIDIEYVLANGIDSHVNQYYKKVSGYSNGSLGLNISLAYTIDNEVYINKRKSIVNGNIKNKGEICNFTKEQLTDNYKNISFDGGGAANVINSDVDKGHVQFSGGGIANIITHQAEEGDTVFNGLGAANIIVKNGKQGDLTFEGAGLANVIVHKSDSGNMDVTAGGAVNVLVRIGEGEYYAKLIALGNISVQMGSGDSRILMFGGLNTHTQIGSGNAFWIAAGGLNVMTRKGQGSIFSVVGGGGNVVTNINSGDATIIALGLGNIITHMGDDEHHSNLNVIGMAAANVVTKKGHGDVQTILGGGINLLTQIGSGKTDAIMLGGGNILTKVGNGDTSAFMFGLGNILTHVNAQKSQTLGVMVGAGNIYTKVGNGTTIGAMLAAGNMMSHIGTGDTYALMGGIGNIFTKVGDGDVLALMVAKGNILTQVGDGQTIALMLAKGGNIFTKVGDGTTMAAMVSMANVMTHIGDGETFALMAGKANIFTKVGSGLTVALMAGNVNVYSQINQPGTAEVGVGIFAGKLNVMTKVGDGTAVAIMFGKANIMTHVGDGSTGAISIAKGNIITKVGDGFTGVVAKAEGNIATHIGKGMSVAVLHGKGNVLTKVGDDIAVGLLISDKGNIMTHIGDGLTVGIVKGKFNIITKVGHGDGVNIAWGDSNIITHIGNGERYNFINGKYNVITRVGQGKEFTVVKAKHNFINLISETNSGELDSYTAAWAENNIITSVGDGQTVVLAKAKNNIITKVGEGDSYSVLWADKNISTHVGDGTKVTLAKADLNVTTDIGDGLNVTAIYGKNNVNTKVGDGTSVSVMWGKLNVNTKVGDGLNVAVMKGKANANIHVGNGLSIAANYGRNNVVIKVGDGDFYNLSVASSNTQSNKLASLFNNIKQHAMGRAGSQAINYLVNGNESHTSGFKNGRGGYKISEPTKDLAGFKLDSKGLTDDYKSPETSHDFEASSSQLSTINKPDIDSAKQNAARALEDTSGNTYSAANGNAYEDSSAALNSNKVAIENDKVQAENDGEKLRQEKEKHHQSSQHVQNQLASTDESALANIGAEYQQQVNQEAEELVSQHQVAIQVLSRLSESDIINSVNGDAGSSVRNPFAQGILSDVDSRVSQATVTADEKLTQINTDSEKYKSQVDQALAKSESAVVEGRKNAEQAKAEERTRVSEATERTAEAEGQKNSAMQSASAAENKANAMQNDARRVVDDAENKANAAKNNAKGVQQEEGDRPTDRKAAEGSGRRVGQVAYTTNAAEVSDESITDSGNTPDRIILDKADGSITKEINRNPAADIVNSGKDAISQIVLPSQDLTSIKSQPNSRVLDVYNPSEVSKQRNEAIHLASEQNYSPNLQGQNTGSESTLSIPDTTFKLTEHGKKITDFSHNKMRIYTDGKDDQSNYFIFAQRELFKGELKKEIIRIASKHVTLNNNKNAETLSSGFSKALAIKYMIAERNYGVGGGKAYISWLEDVFSGYNNHVTATGHIDNIQKSILSDYYYSQFESEIVSLLKITNSQHIFNRPRVLNSELEGLFSRIEKKGALNEKFNSSNIFSKIESEIKEKNEYSDFFMETLRRNYPERVSYNEVITTLNTISNDKMKEGADLYIGELKRSGVVLRDISSESTMSELYSDSGNYYDDLMNKLKNPTENMYLSFNSTEHAMAISIIKKDSRYSWSFFEPSYGGVSFKEYADFKYFMDGFTKNKNNYYNIGGRIYIKYRMFYSDDKQKSYQGNWDIYRSNEQIHLFERLRLDKIEFDLGNNTKGRVVDYMTETNSEGDEKITSFKVDVFDKEKKKTTSVQIDESEFNSAMQKLIPQADRINQLSTVNNLKMVTGKYVIKFVDANSSDCVLIVNLPGSSINVAEQKESKTRYNSQLIVQLEDDMAVNDAADCLVAKNPNTVHVMLDRLGNYQIISGDPGILEGTIRWQVVGHGRGRGIAGKSSDTMGHQYPAELAQNIKKLQDKLDNDYKIKSTPVYISLVGCQLTDENKQQGFARKFMVEAGKQGIKADVAARRKVLSVGVNGRKFMRDEDNNLLYKSSEDKVVLYWNAQGEIESKKEYIRNNIALSEIDISRIGTTDTLGETTSPRAIDRNAQRYTQPTHRATSTAEPSSRDAKAKQEFSYGGNISIQVGDDEFTSVNWGTSNLGIKVGTGGFKTLTFGDNNVMIHIGNGVSKHSVDIAGYQAFEGVQAFIGTRNVAFNYGHSNDVIFMTEKAIISPPLVNPFDNAARISDSLISIAQDGKGEEWLAVQDSQWTLSGAKKYLSDFSGIDVNSSVDYDTLIDLDGHNLRSGRGLTGDIESTLNKKYNQWLSKPGSEQTNSVTRSSQLKTLHNKAVFNIAVAGEGADIVATNSNWNFVFGDNIQSIMDINVGSLFSLNTQQFTSSGRVKTTMTYSPDDLPRQMKNKLINRLAAVSTDTTLGDIFNVDYDESGRIISRDGQEIDEEAVLKEMLEIVAEFGGEKLKAISNPEKLLNGIKANLNMGSSAITSFAQRHGLQDKAPNETDHDSVADIYTNPPAPKNDEAFGFNSLNIPNLFAVIFNKDQQTQLEDMAENIQENMAKDLLNMEQKLFEFLRNSGHLIDDGDIHVSLGNYNFTFGGHGRDLAAYLGDNNNFWGGNGDDVFYGMGISNIFAGGKGNDVGVLMGRENTMFGGVGDDVAVLAGRVNTAYLGEGNDQAFIFGETGVIDTGPGQDYAVVAGNFNQLSSGIGQDYVVIVGNNNAAELGSDDDSCRVFGNQNSVHGDSGNDNISLLGYSSIIYGGVGDDKLIANSMSKFSKVEAGEGNDTIELGGYQNLFSGGVGSDCFVITDAVIDCRVSDASGDDNILFKDINWQDIWFQRHGNDLIVQVDRRIGITTEQSEFESIGSVTFSDYFAGERANIVVSVEDSTSQMILQDGALDSLVDMMSKHDITEGGGTDFMQQIDTSLRNNIAAAWGNVLAA
ncbi:MARTX multifunctional-autoprocessing repeats-in-toxin holotoxin RtxA [Yersinia alsatica]|uniref:MARTX multifunctional-autoprocessing repeats-in-toxin holotoxin RtxA n=1 Tax=Yersinia alsatica TaxID=2890317 RepID=UPI00119D3AA5|nr:MARTX multifunctional-autoprocessing repeats-in-toxin holotoxin RtxA [Yersinia alsatica]